MTAAIGATDQPRQQDQHQRRRRDRQQNGLEAVKNGVDLGWRREPFGEHLAQPLAILGPDRHIGEPADEAEQGEHRQGLAELPPPSAIERAALQRIHAGPEVRLACQLAPRRDLAVVPLLPPDATVRDAKRPGGVEGEERHVTVLFVDLRGSTTLGERKMPYDVVFVLNQFFAEMAEALKTTGGHYSTFTGDGLMALYGLDGSPEEGCKAALGGAAEMMRRLGKLNRSLATELADPLRIGIGLHTGLAVVGTMGPPEAPHLSALGDTVNIAARLEAETKRFDVPLVVSEDVAVLAGIDTTGMAHHRVEIRGRAGRPLGIWCIESPKAISGAKGR